MYRKLTTIIIIGLMVLGHSVNAENQFKTTLLRAAPGKLEQLISQVKAFKKQLQGQLIIMRHSQGDQWDLMLLKPVDKNPLKVRSFNQLADFQQDFIVRSEDSWNNIYQQYLKSNLFHIEMFHALRGKHRELVKERNMENEYLTATARNANTIFTTVLGSDVDCYTIGFYPDLKAFAYTPPLSDAQFEAAAKKAGFKNRDDISFYLRKLILKHHDTLATAVK